MQVNEDVVRKFAYQIWESEGRPDGQADRHWAMAWKLATGEAGPADPFEPLTNVDRYTASAESGQPVASQSQDLSQGQSDSVHASIAKPKAAAKPRATKAASAAGATKVTKPSKPISVAGTVNDASETQAKPRGRKKAGADIPVEVAGISAAVMGGVAMNGAATNGALLGGDALLDADSNLSASSTTDDISDLAMVAPKKRAARTKPQQPTL